MIIIIEPEIIIFVGLYLTICFCTLVYFGYLIYIRPTNNNNEFNDIIISLFPKIIENFDKSKIILFLMKMFLSTE